MQLEDYHQVLEVILEVGGDCLDPLEVHSVGLKVVLAYLVGRLAVLKEGQKALLAVHWEVRKAQLLVVGKQAQMVPLNLMHHLVLKKITSRITNSPLYHLLTLLFAVQHFV